MEAESRSVEIAPVLFVCLGNICRSPLAEGLFRAYCIERGVEIEGCIDSAGTGTWHLGMPADPRSIREGQRRGAEMKMRARQVVSEDFVRFGLLVAMDESVGRDLLAWQGANASKVVLLRSFDPNADGLEVPDPYYGGANGFGLVGDQIEASLPGLFERLVSLASQ